MNAQTEPRTALPALMVGGTVSAIVPQSIEETWRLATMIVEGGLAPQALTGREPRDNATDDDWKRWGKKATSAVTVVVMSGAELGLPPMVSLRSFTVIGGKPALYGDGLIDVVRRSRKATFIHSGFVRNATDEFLTKIGVDADTIADMTAVDERRLGYCWAKRSDTGEERTEIFSIADAKKADLWDERPTARRKIWEDGKPVWKDAPNDAPWFRFPKRMLKWRADGYCLRDLFADVLGGVRDEFESREIEGELIDHDEADAPRRLSTPAAPPKPPVPPKPPAPTIEHTEGPAGEPAETIDEETGEILPPTPPKLPVHPGAIDPFAALLAEVDAKMAEAKDEGDWSDVRTEYAHLQETLSDEEWDSLDAVMHRHYERIRDAADRAEMMQQPFSVG